MGKIFKRIVSLLLGSILGISSILATVFTSAYYMYSELPVGGIIAGENDDTLGDLGDMSIEDIIAFLNKGTEAPENFTIADLRDKYGFDIIGLINGLGGSEPIIDPNDKQFLADIESLSVFKIFTEEGLSGFLSDLPVGVVLGFIPEDTLLSKAERDKLRSYSVGQLIATDEATGELGIMSAIGEVKLGGVFPSLFEDGDMDGNYTAKDGGILNLIANVEFGGIIDVVTKKSTIGEEIVEGGLSDIGGMTVGDIMENVMGEGNELAGTLNNLFNGMQIKDMFEKDVATGEYKFVEDKLLDNIKVGAVLGYEKDEDGVWHEKGEDGELGKPVTGLLEEIASLDLTTLYHVITGEGTATEKIHDILLVVGDLSVGDVFETLGYTKDGDEWLKKDGTPVESELLKVLFDISIEDIVGEAGTELSGTNIRQNLVNALIGGAGDLTVGEGLGELFGVELNEDGKFVYVKGAKEGEEVNPFMANLLNIKVADVVESFGGEKVDVTAIVDVFERALAGTNLGELLGAEKINGKWFKDDQLVNGFAAIFYDLDFAGLFSALKQLQSEDFSYAAIIESFFPELKVADIVNLIVTVEEVESEVDGAIVSEYYYKDQAVQPGLNTILNLKLWEVVAGFDKNHPFNLKAVIKDIPLGEVFNCIKTENGWKITDQRTLTGAISELFDFTLGDILSDEEGATKDKLVDTLKRITLGDVFTLALGYDAETGKFASTKEGEVPNRILVSLCGWDMSVNDIINIVKGDTKVDAAFIRGELTDVLGGIPFGEALRGFVTDFDEDDDLTITVLPELSGILDPIFNTDWKFYIDLVFDIVDGKKLDVVEVLSSIYGDTTLGDFVAPIIKLEREGDEYVLSDGKSLGVAITGFLDMVIVDVVEVFVKGEGDIISKLDKLLNEKIINVDFMLGEYLTMATGHKYEDGKWIDKNGEDVYEPLSDLLSVNILEAVNTLLLDKSVTKAEKRDYLIDIFDGLTIKDVLEIIPAIKNSEKALIQKVGDVRIDNLIRDLFAEDAKILEIVDEHLGTVALGNIVDLIMVATESGEDWLDKNGNEHPLLLECLFGVTVSDIIGWIDEKTPVLTIVKDVVGSVSLADVADVILDVSETATTQMGLPTVSIGGKALPAIVGDILKLTVNDIVGIIEHHEKTDISAFVHKVTADKTVLQYVEDILNKEIANAGLSELLGLLNPAEIVDVILKLKTDATNKMSDDPMIAYFLNITDQVLIGEYIKGIVRNDDEGKWYKDGNAVSGILNTVYELPTSVVLYVFAVIMNPSMIMDMLGDQRVGTLVKDFYNGINAIDSEIVGDNDAGYTVDGAYKFLLEDIVNKTVQEIVDDIKNKDFVPNLKEIFLNRPIGDYLFDTVGQFVLKGDKAIEFDFDGFGADHFVDEKYLLEGDFADLISAIFNLNVQALLDAEKKGDYVKGLFADLLIGDILYDVMDIVLKDDNKFGIVGSGYANTAANEGKYELTDSVLLETIFNINIIDLVNADNKVDFIKATFESIYIGDVAALILDVKGTENNWTLKEKEINPFVGDIFDIQVGDILGWIDTKPFPVKGVITEVFGERTIAELVKTFVKLEDAVNVDGWTVYALNGKGFPLIVSDIFNLSVSEIVGWFDQSDKTSAIITGVLGGRTFGDHMSDIGVAQFDKSSFEVLHDTDVAEFVNGLIKADNKLEYIKPYINGIYIGHLAGFVLKVDGEEGAWTLKGEAVKSYIGMLFDIQIGEIFNWIDTKQIKTIVADVFGDVTFGVFFKDLGLDIFDKHVFDCLREEKVADFIIYILDRKFDEIKRIAGPIRVGDLANLVVSAIERNDDAWVNGDKALPYLLSGLFDVCVTDVVNLIDGKFKPEVISPVVAKINGEYTVIEHVENIINKDIKNNGVDKILGFKLSEMLDVMLGLKTDVKENMTKDPKIDYILNITDNVFFGDFMGYEKSEDGVWSNANGEATGITKTIVSIPVSYVLYAVAVVVKPSLIKEAAGDQRIGTLIKDAYNKFDKIDSEIVGDNDAGYVVNGAYKFLMEDLANKTVGQMYDSVFENKTVVKDLKEFFLNRPIGDYLFDTVGQFVLKGDKAIEFDFDGYGADHFVDGKYLLEGDFADVISAVFNLNIQDLLDAEKKGDYVKELFADILIGDILYDVMDIVLKDDNRFGIVGSGYANTAANEGKYELAKSVLLETLFNVNVIKLIESKDIVQFIKDTFASIYVGDIAALVLDVTGTETVWMIKGKDVNPFVGDIFDIQISDVIRWLDTNPVDVKAIIDEVFGERVIADVVKLAVKLEVAENVDGILVYAMNGKGFPLIVSDLFNISVSEIISWTSEKDSKKLLETVVTGVLGKRTFGDHMSDIGVEKFDKASFAVLHDTNVGEFVNGLIKAEKILDYVKPYVKDIFVGDLLSFVLKVDGVKGDWTLNGEPTVEYIEVLFDIQIGEILGWIDTKELKTVVKDVFDDRTFNDFFEELNVEIIKKKFFDGLREAEVATFVIDLLDENTKDKLGYVLSYFEEAYVGDAAALVLKVEGEKGAWLMGDPAEPAKAVLASLFDVQIKRIIEWKDDKELKIIDVIDEVFGGNAIVDFVDLVAKTKKATRESGAEVWALGDSALPLIVSDVLDVKVGAIIDIINDKEDNDDKNYVIKEVVKAITGTKDIETYTKDLKLDIVSEKYIFKKLRETQVAVFVAGILDAEDRVDHLLSYFEDAYVGDVASLVAKVERGASYWMTGDPAEPAKAVLASVFNVRIKRVLEWKDDKELKIIDVIDEVFGNLSLIHFVELFAEIGTGTRESGVEVFTIKDKALPLIASDALAVKVGTIIDIINEGEGNEDKNFVIKEVVKAITSVKNFEIYTKDLKLDIVSEQDLFRKFRETQVAVFVAELLDATDKVDYILSYFKSARIGDVAALAIKDLHEESERAWYVGEKALKLIASDLLSLEIGSILDWVKTISEKETVSDMVHALAEGRTVLTYVEDLIGKDIDNNGVDKLLSLKVTDIVDVILGLKEPEKENITKDKKIDFFLNHTDEIMIGEFLKGYTYDSEEEKWSDANGNVANDTMQAVLKAPVSYVIYLIAVIVKPELIVDAIGDQRIGTLIKEPYNKIEKIDSEIVGDNDAGYVVNGAFKAVMEDLVNLTVEEIYNWNKDKILKTELEARLLDRNLGDYLYDVIVQFVYKEDKSALDLEGFASEKTDAEGNYHLVENYARLLNKVFNLNVKETIDGLKAKNGWVDEFIKDVYLGDILFDLINKKMGEKLNFTGDAYAIDNTMANGDKYVLDRNFKDVLDVVFNISLYDLTKAKNIVDFAKEKASDLVVGDLVFDLARKFLNDKLNLQVTGTFAWVNESENGNAYSLDGNFKDVLDVLFNINVVELINADKKDEFLKEKTADLLVGDLIFDPIRKLFNAKYNLGLEEKFAWENKAENGGKYFAPENASEVLTRTFNIKLSYVYSYILEDKAINMFLHDFYSSLTLGDLAYDLTRKFVDEKLALEMRGFAWQYKADETLMTGKLARLFRAAFSITLDDLYQVAKKRTTVKEFLTEKFGQLDLGETVAPFVELTLEKALDLTYVYDKENDYELTVEGNFAEFLNAIFGVKLEGLINNKDVVKFLLGECGALEEMPVGHLVGYLTKVKALKKTFKYTTVTHEYDGEWIISGAYSVPMNILCNDLTFGEIYANRKKLKANVIIPYFGEVAVGQLMGGNVLDGVWYKPNGNAVKTHGAKNVIMNAIYDVTVEQLLAKNFDPTTIIEDIYAGQLMSYYYCGEFKYSKVESDDYGLCEDETHVDGVDGYHVHLECEIEDDGHDHADMGDGWYVLEDGKYKEVGAIENAVAGLRLKVLMEGRFSMAETLADVKLGSAMNLVYCDGTPDCEILEDNASHVCDAGWYKVETVGGVEVYTKEKILIQKISEVNMKELFTNGLDLETTFDGTMIGDVLGYAHCYVDADGNRVCDEALGHGDLDHKTKNMWYIFDESKGAYRKATPLERTMASVAMSSIVNGNFDVEETLENITLGEFMSYEKCTGDENCFIHDDHTDPSTYVADAWYKEGASGYERVTDNLALAIADFTIKNMQDATFIDQVLAKIKAQVTIGDIFGSTDGTPLSLLPEDTTIGNINSALTDTFKTSTAGDMYNAGVLPFDDATFSKMDDVYGGLVMSDIKSTVENDEFDRIATKYHAKRDAAIAAAGTAVAPTDPDYQLYVHTVGEYFWMSLTANELVDILINAIHL